jgi:hypothetical protein
MNLLLEEQVDMVMFGEIFNFDDFKDQMQCVIRMRRLGMNNSRLQKEKMYQTSSNLILSQTFITLMKQMWYLLMAKKNG